MSYASLERVESNLLPPDDLANLLNDGAMGTIDANAKEALAAKLLAAVDDEINALLTGVCDVPFGESSTPPIINQIADRLLAHMLWARRGGEIPQSVRDMRSWADKRLDQILTGKIQLKADEEPRRGGTPLVSTSESERVFSPSVFGSMPK